MSNVNYSMIEVGFIKEAVDQGIDPMFLHGFIKEAQSIMDYYKEAINVAEKNSGDPEYRHKLANELLYASPHVTMFKTADGQLSAMLNNPQALDWLKGIGGHLGGNAQNSGGIGGAAVGGGGGALLGLLLGKLLFNNPMMGLMLGGVGGGVLGNMYGNQSLSRLFGGQPTQPQEPTGAQQPPPTTSEALANQIAEPAEHGGSLNAVNNHPLPPQPNSIESQKVPVANPQVGNPQINNPTLSNPQVQAPAAPTSPLIQPPSLQLPAPPSIPGANNVAHAQSPLTPQQATVAQPHVPAGNTSPQPLVPPLPHQMQLSQNSAMTLRNAPPPMATGGPLPSTTLGGQQPALPPVPGMPKPKPGATSMNPAGGQFPERKSKFFP